MRVFGHVLSSPLDDQCDEKEVVKSADFSNFDTTVGDMQQSIILDFDWLKPPLSF
jgi:hypothetical protein